VSPNFLPCEEHLAGTGMALSLMAPATQPSFCSMWTPAPGLPFSEMGTESTLPRIPRPHLPGCDALLQWHEAGHVVLLVGRRVSLGYSSCWHRPLLLPLARPHQGDDEALGKLQEALPQQGTLQVPWPLLLHPLWEEARDERGPCTKYLCPGSTQQPIP
jgi:hypothetical protein